MSDGIEFPIGASRSEPHINHAYEKMPVLMYVCMCVCIYVYMYVCMYVCM